MVFLVKRVQGWWIISYNRFFFTLSRKSKYRRFYAEITQFSEYYVKKLCRYIFKTLIDNFQIIDTRATCSWTTTIMNGFDRLETENYRFRYSKTDRRLELQSTNTKFALTVGNSSDSTIIGQLCFVRANNRKSSSLIIRTRLIGEHDS